VGQSLTRLAVSSCFHHSTDADIALAHMHAQNFDLILELGDNVYADTNDARCSRFQTRERVCVRDASRIVSGHTPA
jgi:phosphodiesterase/alkaline phosphatase D-like protein